MAWTSKIFRQRDIWVLLLGFFAVQALASLTVDRFMFHPIKNGYGRDIDGFVDIGTNGVVIAARIVGASMGKKAIMYCHGNAEDLTAINGRFDALVDDGYTVATFDYPGYGLSDGVPDEEGCYRNARRLYDWLVYNSGFSPEDIIVVGYSIGTGVATEIAASREVGGLWLESAYLSAPRAVTRIRLLSVDPFPNVKKIGHVECPIVILHGTSDSIVPYSQGRSLYDLAPTPKWFVPVDGAGHEDVIEKMGLKMYIDTLRCFLDKGSVEGVLGQ